jgi:methionyl aminopeptidase
MAQLIIKSNEEIEIMKAGAQILGKTHAEICKIIKPGISTMELERIAFQFIIDNNAKPSFKGYQGFPYTLCISLNDQVVHGMPNNTLLKDGDIVSVDCGVFYQGFHTDSAYTYEVGEVKEEVKQLLKTTKESLYKGIDKAIVGNRIGDIAFEIQHYCETKGYSVVRELVGHGVGKNLHEKPEVPNYGQRGKGLKLVENMVLAIEPMINLGKRNVVQEKDGWTIRTSDRLPSAHFEHTVAIKNEKAEVITTFAYIEEVLKNK